uniref:Uncharacterized protein n=1 Tax=Magnetococcus massalia (strain MO-1) TaxID=451514 RepID=A0A1S7LGL3_MAGMO|nr:protein of unknown function [Candidatus Magnetococcus massalia]
MCYPINTEAHKYSAENNSNQIGCQRFPT